jgi:hypothetical protein
MWHTHMMIPESYAADTKAIAGRVLDHDDTLNESVLIPNLEHLLKLKMSFGAKYTLTLKIYRVFVEKTL